MGTPSWLRCMTGKRVMAFSQSSATRPESFTSARHFNKRAEQSSSPEHGAGPALTQCGVESLFPAGVIDGPEDLCFVAGGERRGPGLAVALVIGDIEAVDYRHAAGEFALRFDFEEMLGLRRDDGRIEGDGHGDGVGKRDAVFAGLFEEGLLGAAVAFDGKFGGGGPETQHSLDVRRIEYCFAAAEVPADELDRQAAPDDDAGGFGIAPDVVFGGGSDVAFAAGRAAHDYAAAEFRGDRGFLFEGESDVGERAQRDHDEAGVRFDSADYGVDGALLFGSAPRGGVAVIAQAIASVKPGRADVRAL